MFSILSNIIIILLFTYFNFYYINKYYPPLSYSYIDMDLLNTYNISKNDWCSIEIKSYLILFFLCFERIPNISIIITAFI